MPISISSISVFSETCTLVVTAPVRAFLTSTTKRLEPERFGAIVSVTVKR